LLPQFDRARTVEARAHLLSEPQCESPLAFRVAAGVDLGKARRIGKVPGELSVNLGQERYVNVIADVSRAGTYWGRSCQPALHEIGREPWFLVGTEGIGNDKLTQVQTGAAAVKLEDPRGQGLGKTIGREIGKSLGASTFTPFENRTGQDQLAATRGLESLEHGDEVAGVVLDGSDRVEIWALVIGDVGSVVAKQVPVAFPDQGEERVITERATINRAANLADQCHAPSPREIRVLTGTAAEDSRHLMAGGR